jgi:hypothetical protein
MVRQRIAASVLASITALAAAGGASEPPDPLAVFGAGTTMTAVDRARIDAGQPFVAIVPARGRDVGIAAAVRIEVGGDRLAVWARHSRALHQSEYVPVIVPFSDPPALDDLRRLALDRDELDDIRRCRPRHCGLKLSAAEIGRLQAAITVAGEHWQAAAQQAFREVVLSRVQQYLAAGHSSVPNVDEHRPVAPSAEFAALVGGWPPRPGRQPRITAGGPHPEAPPRGESFVYWSKELLGTAKPVISVTHVVIVRGSEWQTAETTVFATQVYATHYMTGSQSITSVTRPTAGRPRYLIYQNRTRADVFGGVFGGMIRRAVESRLRHEAPRMLLELRRKLESGEPPPQL